MEINECFVQIDAGHVEPFFFVIDGDVIVLTDRQGRPRDFNGTTLQHRMKAGEDVHVAARALGRSALSEMSDGAPPGFNHPLNYGNDRAWR